MQSPEKSKQAKPDSMKHLSLKPLNEIDEKELQATGRVSKKLSDVGVVVPVQTAILSPSLKKAVEETLKLEKTEVTRQPVEPIIAINVLKVKKKVTI